MSRNDIVLLAWGSRSMRSVGLPRSARPAARLIAVVVLPTPPFWFAIATIMCGISDACGYSRDGPGGGQSKTSYTQRREACALLHLVLAEVVRVETLQPFLQAIHIRLLRRRVAV